MQNNVTRMYKIQCHLKNCEFMDFFYILVKQQYVFYALELCQGGIMDRICSIWFPEESKSNSLVAKC